MRKLRPEEVELLAKSFSLERPELSFKPRDLESIPSIHHAFAYSRTHCS
jgi:hypothetical protein